MGKSSKKSSSSTTKTADAKEERRSQRNKKAPPPLQRRSSRSKEFPFLPLGIVFGVFAIFLYIPYKRYGKNLFFPRADYQYGEEEWQSLMKDKKILLLGGPHRGGTSILWKSLKQHHDISGFGNTFETGVDESEGILMQDVYPRFGIGNEDFRTQHPGWSTSSEGVGQYALHPDVHMTEESGLITTKNRLKLWNRFGPHWNLTKPIWMEKSPPTIVMTRFLQAMYDDSSEKDDRTYFIILARHPLATVLATENMMGKNYLSYDRVMMNYVKMYQYYLEDKSHLKNPPQLVKLEDFAKDPKEVLSKLVNWLELDDATEWMDAILPTIHSNPNAKYQKRWCQEEGLQSIRMALITKYQKVFTTELAFLGYDLSTWCDGMGTSNEF
mmetsp:Transcript_10490/g.16094  ORF Transcript_10490/g.16094 Transcript_10490/m.16094 type:complete len:383 (+) Transcript_10490:43-1191(+)